MAGPFLGGFELFGRPARRGGRDMLPGGGGEMVGDLARRGGGGEPAEQNGGDDQGARHALVSAKARATATRVASLPRAPTIDSPTGRPSTIAPGMLTCGAPVSPPWQHNAVIRSRSRSEEHT